MSESKYAKYISPPTIALFTLLVIMSTELPQCRADSVGWVENTMRVAAVDFRVSGPRNVHWKVVDDTSPFPIASNDDGLLVFWGQFHLRVSADEGRESLQNCRSKECTSIERISKSSISYDYYWSSSAQHGLELHFVASNRAGYLHGLVSQLPRSAMMRLMLSVQFDECHKPVTITIPPRTLEGKL